MDVVRPAGGRRETVKASRRPAEHGVDQIPAINHNRYAADRQGHVVRGRVPTNLIGVSRRGGPVSGEVSGESIGAGIRRGHQSGIGEGAGRDRIGVLVRVQDPICLISFYPESKGRGRAQLRTASSQIAAVRPVRGAALVGADGRKSTGVRLEDETNSVGAISSGPVFNAEIRRKVHGEILGEVQGRGVPASTRFTIHRRSQGDRRPRPRYRASHQSPGRANLSLRGGRKAENQKEKGGWEDAGARLR